MRLKLDFQQEPYKHMQLESNDHATERECAAEILSIADRYATVFPLMKTDINKYKAIYGMM